MPIGESILVNECLPSLPVGNALISGPFPDLREPGGISESSNEQLCERVSYLATTGLPNKCSWA